MKAADSFSLPMPASIRSQRCALVAAFFPEPLTCNSLRNRFFEMTPRREALRCRARLNLLTPLGLYSALFYECNGGFGMRRVAAVILSS